MPTPWDGKSQMCTFCVEGVQEKIKCIRHKSLDLTSSYSKALGGKWIKLAWYILTVCSLEHGIAFAFRNMWVFRAE